MYCLSFTFLKLDIFKQVNAFCSITLVMPFANSWKTYVAATLPLLFIEIMLLLPPLAIKGLFFTNKYYLDQ